MSPLHFQSRSLRVAVILLIFTMFALQIWFQFLNRESFSALASANLLLVQKVEKFDADVAWAVVQQTLTSAIVIGEQARQFDQDTRNRVANMNNWAASSAKTRDEVIEIHSALENFAAESREQRALQAQRYEELSQKILDAVASTNRNTAITRRHADVAAHKLSQLQKQNRELKHEKRKLFPW